MPNLNITVAYGPADTNAAARLAEALQAHGYTLSPMQPGGFLLAVISPDGLADPDLLRTINAAQGQQIPVILVETQPTSLPDALASLRPIPMHDGTPTPDVLNTVDTATNAPAKRAQNLRAGLIVGAGIIVLFVLYTVAIVVFDIEAPQDDFERAYTRDAAIIGGIAGTFVPVSTDEAANFEITLESNQISAELATVVVGTATQAAVIGGVTPIPPAMMTFQPELSEVRQLATQGAIERAAQTAAASDAEQESIAATATQAAIDAAEQLNQQMMTVTAAAEGE